MWKVVSNPNIESKAHYISQVVMEIKNELDHTQKDLTKAKKAHKNVCNHALYWNQYTDLICPVRISLPVKHAILEPVVLGLGSSPTLVVCLQYVWPVYPLPNFHMCVSLDVSHSCSSAVAGSAPGEASTCSKERWAGCKRKKNPTNAGWSRVVMVYIGGCRGTGGTC